MNLSTLYLGLPLSSPLVVGASPFSDDIYSARCVQDAGAGAIVMRSLFEEQIYLDAISREWRSGSAEEGNPGVTSVFPRPAEYQLTPDGYLVQLAKLKSALTIPIIASLNGYRAGGWIDYARRFEAAGADAIELNLYHLGANPDESSFAVEGELMEAVAALIATVRIPVAVKLQPYFTAPVHFARSMQQLGAKGIVIFNRVYQSDISTDNLERVSQQRLTAPAEFLLRLRWLALLRPHVSCSLAVTGGVLNADCAIKAVLLGADVVQVVSALLCHGPRYLGTMREGIEAWAEKHGYQDLTNFRGIKARHASEDTIATERGDYHRILQQWKL